MSSSGSEKIVKISQVKDGVEMVFSKEVPVETIKKQVSSCQASTCDCCTPAFREKVESFSNEETDDGIKVKITGDITKEQVQENVMACAPKLKE